MDYENECTAPSPVTCVDIRNTLASGRQLDNLKRKECDAFPLPPCPAKDRRYKTVPTCKIYDSLDERLLPYGTIQVPPRCYPRRQRKCPLRIMELAMPSKRLCMETWRTMKDVLPAYMVERLKKQLMDENIMVGIPEAFSTFKRKSPGVHKRCPPQTKSKAKCAKDMEQIKMISALFGSKLVGKLYKPQTTKLNPKLEKISRIVNKDVLDLIKKRKPRFTKDTCNDEILNEVSNRVAIWISIILQDASYKILEDELKELEEQEGPVLDILDKLVDDVLDKIEPYPPGGGRGDTSADEHFESVSEGGKSDHSAEHQYKDSFSSPEDVQEEEIGDANEYKEDNIEAVIDESETAENHDDADKVDVDIAEIEKESLTDKNDRLSIAEDTENIENTNEQASEPPEHIVTQSENMESEKVSLEDKEGNLGSTQDTEEINDAKESTTGQNDHSQEIIDHENSLEPVKDEDDHVDNAAEDAITEISVKVGETVLPNDIGTDLEQSPDNPSDSTVENTVPSEEDNESQKDVSTHNETFEIQSLDDKTDTNSLEKSKPGQGVTIVQDGEGSNEEKGTLDSPHIPQVYRDESVDRKVKFSDSEIGPVLKSSKPDIILGPVNEDLLSNADESWPDKFIPLRPAASISKSVESLGKIREHEELHHEEDMVDETHKRDDSKDILAEKELSTDELSKERERRIKSNESVEISDTYYDGGVPSQPYGKKIDGKDTSGGDAGDAKINGEKHRAEEILASNTQNYEAIIQQKGESPDKAELPKFDYKVCLDTAPSWVRKGYGEPSEDDLITQIRERQKKKDLQLRNWINNLCNAATRLEKWNQWIDTACFNAQYLKKCRKVKHSRSCHKAIQDWVRLQESVDNDALLWTKLYQRTRVRLQRNRDIPKNIKCECMRY